KDTKADTLDCANLDLVDNETKKSMSKITVSRRDRVPKMTIRKLSQTFSKKTTESKSLKHSQFGTQISASRLALAAISPVPIPILKSMTGREKGGTLLIDASGSMEISDNMLKE